jgi:multidrug efflux pump subunit AcrA (membrane-fusion protein)
MQLVDPETNNTDLPVSDISEATTVTTVKKVPESLRSVKPKKVGQRIARVVIFMIVLTGLVLWLVPWQQTIVGAGEVTVFDPNSRPQTVEAQIPGRITKWNVTEGQMVQKGDVIAEIEDIDSKFLDPDILKRFANQKSLLENSQKAELSRAERLQSQIEKVEGSRVQQLKNAEERVRQAKNRYNGAKAALKQAEKNLTGFIKVAKASAEQRKLNAQDIVRQNEQSLIAAKQQLQIEKINFERIKFLADKGLESKRSLELAETSFVSAQTRVQAIEDAIKAAQRIVQLGALGEDQAEIDIARQRDVVNQAKETVLAAERDISIAENDIVRIDNDTNATISNLEASLQSAQSTIMKAGSDIEKITSENANINARRSQGKILAPTSGRIVRVTRFGTGSTVKSGDILATIAPEKQDRVVEIMVSDNDVSFIRIGRPVRLTFAGYPAVQFNGFPGLAIGTFGGKIAFIDPMDDGTSRFRVIVKEDNQVLPTGQKDKGWPVGDRLRPGAEAVGWIMLDTVPLGFELWRQFNGFPPRLSDGNPDPRLGKAGVKGFRDEKGDKVDKSDKADYLSPSIKVKSKK